MGTVENLHSWVASGQSRIDDVAITAEQQAEAERIFPIRRQRTDEKTVRIWDMATGKDLRRLQGMSEVVTSVSLSPNGRRLAISQRKGRGEYFQHAGVWDPGTGERLVELKDGDRTRRVVYSPNGKWMASGGSGGCGVRLVRNHRRSGHTT